MNGDDGRSSERRERHSGSLPRSLGLPSLAFFSLNEKRRQSILTCAGGTRPYPARYAGLPSVREAMACWRSRAKPLNVPETMSLEELIFSERKIAKRERKKRRGGFFWSGYGEPAFGGENEHAFSTWSRCPVDLGLDVAAREGDAIEQGGSVPHADRTFPRILLWLKSLGVAFFSSRLRFAVF